MASFLSSHSPAFLTPISGAQGAAASSELVPILFGRTVNVQKAAKGGATARAAALYTPDTSSAAWLPFPASCPPATPVPLIMHVYAMLCLPQGWADWQGDHQGSCRQAPIFGTGPELPEIHHGHCDPLRLLQPVAATATHHGHRDSSWPLRSIMVTAIYHEPSFIEHPARVALHTTDPCLALLSLRPPPPLHTTDPCLAPPTL